MVITVAIAAAEVAGGLISGSLVLLADAAHMTADAAGVGLSLLAVFMAARPATGRRTFGYARTEILAAMANALLLLAMTTVIIGEGIRRLSGPPEVGPGIMIIFGVAALAGNGMSLALLHHGAAESLNVRGAFLEVASDTFGAAAVIVTGTVVATDLAAAAGRGGCAAGGEPAQHRPHRGSRPHDRAGGGPGRT